MFVKRLVLSAFMIFAVLYLAGCGGSSQPISVAITASSTTVDGVSGNTVTLTAAVAHDKNAAGVAWSVSGGGSVSGSGTSATYTPPAASSSAVTATVTATSTADSTKTASVQITVPAAASVKTSAMTAGAVGTAYSVTMAANGGIAPYTWSITSGTLPAGLTMSSAGAISGTPMAAGTGTATLTFKVTDSGKPNPLTATANLGLTVAAAPPIAFGAGTPADGTMNAAYTGAITAGGGAGSLTYTVSAGALPDGMALSTAGALAGTPTKVGTFSFTITAADAFGDSASQAYTLKIAYPALAVTALTPPTGYVGSAYTSTTLAATGGSGTGYTWAVSSGSALPEGLTLSTAGVLAGNPTTTGATTTSITVTDSASNTATGSLSFTVKAGVSIGSAPSLPVAYAGSAYSQQLTATGGSETGYTWSVGPPAAVRAPRRMVASSAPFADGLTLSPTGLVSGTPTATGSWQIQLTVTDSVGNTASTTFTLTVNAGISIGAITLPKGYQGTAYPGATFAATGGSTSGFTWTWAAASGSSLPAGLALSTAGVVSGTPTTAGTFSVVVTVTDSASNTASQTYSLTIEATLAISSPATLKSGTINIAYTTTLTASGGSGTYSTWTITAGAAQLVPLNLTLSSAGVLSGTPTVVGSATFTAEVTDSESHTATASLTVNVYSALTITTATLPAGNVGTAYSQTLGAGGGSGSGYTWTASNSNLATYGLSLSTQGVVSGTPTTSGTASFTPTVTDSSNNTATATAPLTILIYGTLSLPATNPASLPSTGTTGVAYTGSVTATGGSGNYTWAITGMPADGLTTATSGATLSVTGTPTAPATVTFTAKVTDTTTNLSVGPYTYTITITNPQPMSFSTGTTLQSGTVSQAYTQTIEATGGVAPYTWAINGTNVPGTGAPQALSNGLNVSTTGTLSLSIGGTPTSATTITFTAKITDSLGGSVGPTTFTIPVNSAGSQVSGHIALTNSCPGANSLPAIQLSINTTPAKNVTVGNDGNYTFAGVPNGTYTITPSIPGSGSPSSIFYPVTQSVTVSNADMFNKDFQVSLGYTISGTISYTGASTGPISVLVNGTTCGGQGLPGTSISAPGTFTIRGVAPGGYTIQAWMDTLGQGQVNAVDPQGAANVTVLTSDVSHADITLSDQHPSLPSSGPKLDAVMPTDKGVVVAFAPIFASSSGRMEAVTSYELQWSTNSSFSSPSSLTLAAIGDSSDVWIVNSSTHGVPAGTLNNGTAYYFRARGILGSNQTPWTVYGNASSKSVTIGQPSGTGYNTVAGSVIIPSGVTVAGPLYVGFYSNTQGMFAARIATPTTGAGSPNPFTVNVPNGSFFFFGILDQNNNGLIDVGDLTNTNGHGSNISVSGNVTGQNLTLPTANSTATIYTQYYSQLSNNGSFTAYSIAFIVNGQTKLPVSATLNSGPNVISPVDMGLCLDCGKPQLEYTPGLGETSLGGAVPVVGDTYAFTVTYSDKTTENLTAKVTGVLGPSQLVTNLSPSVTSTTSTPTFTWTYPASPSSYSYQFGLYSSTSSGNIWDIPSGSASAGFNYSDIPGSSITWGVDPTNSNNTPSGSLSSQTTYNWWITTYDSNNNSAQAQTYFVIP